MFKKYYIIKEILYHRYNKTIHYTLAIVIKFKSLKLFYTLKETQFLKVY